MQLACPKVCEIQRDVDESEESCDSGQVVHVCGSLVREKHFIARGLVVVVLHASAADGKQLLSPSEEPVVLAEKGL